MKVIAPGYEILQDIDGEAILKKLESIARVCYKSETKITDSSYAGLIKSLIQRGHESVLEHEKITVRIICDRGVSHELVRHRIASYSQESTRFCNYSNERFGSELTFIKPCFWAEDSEEYKIWHDSMQEAEKHYFDLLKANATPQEARSVLPNSLKTEIVMTMNLREWRHFFRLRTAEDAHPQMKEITCPLLRDFQNRIPILFDDIGYVSLIVTIPAWVDAMAREKNLNLSQVLQNALKAQLL